MFSTATSGASGAPNNVGWDFLAAARYGMDAQLDWPGLGEVTTRELVLGTLLPMAHEGLRRWGVDAEVRDRFLGVIGGRAQTAATARAGRSPPWRPYKTAG